MLGKRGLAFVAYLLFVPLSAGTWHLALFRDVYTRAAMRTEPVMALGMLSIAIQALVLSFAYPHFRLAGTPLRNGLAFGLLIGFFLGSYGVLAEAGKFDVGPLDAWVVHEGAFFLLQYVVVGLVFGAIFGRSAQVGSSAAG